MGTIEEASKVATTVAQSLASTPVILALVVFNVIYMGLGFWQAKHEGDRWEKLVENAMKWCPATAPQQPNKD